MCCSALVIGFPIAIFDGEANQGADGADKTDGWWKMGTQSKGYVLEKATLGKKNNLAPLFILRSSAGWRGL